MNASMMRWLTKATVLAAGCATAAISWAGSASADATDDFPIPTG